MVAISPIFPMTAPSSRRVELKTDSSTLGTTQFVRPPPTKVAERSFAAVDPAGSSSTFPAFTQVAGPSRQSAPTTFATGTAGSCSRAAALGSASLAACMPARAPPSVAVKTKPPDFSPKYQRRPSPLLLSNFFTPLLHQFPIVTRSNYILTAAQGKYPTEPTVDNFPPLPNKPMNVNTTTLQTGTSYAQEPERNAWLVPPNQPINKQQIPPSTAFDQPNGKVDVSFSSASKRKLSSHDGEPALILSQEDEEKLSLPYSYTLIGKFSRGKPSMVDLRKEISASSFTGEVHLGLHDFRHVFFKFELEEDFHRMWSRRVWNFSGFQARIFRWSKNFSPEIESSVAPVWINLPQLPLHLFEKDSLFAIASTVGNPLKLDHATASAKKILRPSEARILVEIDVLKPRIHRVWIGGNEWGRWQSIIFEDFPDYCTNCKKMGHSATHCKPPQPRKEARMEDIRKGKRKMWIPVVNSTKSHEPMVGQSSGCPESSGAATVVGGEAVAASDANGVPTPVEETAADQGKAHAMKEVESPKKKAKEQEENFLANLGQFLELLNQERENGVLDRTVGFPLPALEPSLKTQIVTDLVPTTRQEADTINGKQSGDQGNFNNASPLVTHVQPPLDKTGKSSNTKFQFSKSDLEATVEEDRRIIAAPAATAAADPAAHAATDAAEPTTNIGVGERVEFVLEVVLSGKQMGATMRDLDVLSGNNPCNDSGKQMGATMRDLAGLSGNIPCNDACPVVLSDPTIGEGDKVEGNLSLASTTLTAQKLTQDVEVIREKNASDIVSPVLVKGSGNMPHQTPKSLRCSGLRGLFLEESSPRKDICDDHPGTVARSPFEPESLSGYGSVSYFAQQISAINQQLAAGLGNGLYDENEEDDEVAIARGALEGGKQKIRMSDRVLRSMTRASNTDPRPVSL